MLKILDLLVDGPDEDVGALEDLPGAQLRPAPRKLLGSLASVVRHDDPLDQCVQFESLVSVAGRLSHELDPLIDARPSPAG